METPKPTPVSDRMKTKRATKQRRKGMVIKVLVFNIQGNKLSHEKVDFLKLLNFESTAYYNYLIYITNQPNTITDDFGNQIPPPDLFHFNTKSNSIQLFDKDGDTYWYELQVLSSQMKQGILSKIQASIKGLAALKKKGYKIGRIKYKHFVNIPLTQYNRTYYLSDNMRYLRLQGSKLKIPLIRNKNLVKLCKNLGIGNVSLNALINNNIIELANSEIVGNKFYLTIYFDPVSLKQAKLFQGSNLPQLNTINVGIDAGISNELTINVGELHNSIDIDSRTNKKQKKLKQYQKRFNKHISNKKKKKESYKTNQYYDLKHKINQLYQEITRDKIDATNKIVSILKECNQVTFQDEMIKSWHANKAFRYSKKMQRGILGRVYAKLRDLSKEDDRFVMLSRSCRTTKTCICGTINQHITLKDRVYVCHSCGYQNARDIHSSYIINNWNNGKNIGCGTQPIGPGSNGATVGSRPGKTITSTGITSVIADVIFGKLKTTVSRVVNHTYATTYPGSYAL
jgi:putative transposase